MLAHGGLGQPNLAALGTAAQTQAITVNRIDDVDTPFVPTVLGLYTINPAPFIDTDNFFSPTMGLRITPAYFSDMEDLEDLLDPTITTFRTITLNLLTDTDSFFAPAITLVGFLAPFRIDDVDTLFTPTISVSAVSLSPSRINDADTLFAPTIGAGVTPSFFIDSDAFFTPTVATVTHLTLNLIVDVDDFFAPQVAYPQTVSVGVRIADTDLFFAPHVFTQRPSFVPAGFESQVGVWRKTGKEGRTGKRYRIYPPPES